MAEDFTAASSEWMSCGANPATAAPATLFALIKANTNTNQQTIIHIGNTGKAAATKHFQIYYKYSGTRPSFFGIEYSGVGSNQTLQYTDPGAFAGVWRSIFFVIEGAAVRKLYIDGILQATGTTNIGLSVPLGSTRIGRGKVTDYADFTLGPCGIIPYAMTAEQIATIPLFIDPSDYPKAGSGAVWQMYGGESPVPNAVGDGTYELTVETAPTAVEANPPGAGTMMIPGTHLI